TRWLFRGEPGRPPTGEQKTVNNARRAALPVSADDASGSAVAYSAQPLALECLHIDALVDGDLRGAAAPLAADQHPDVEELAVRVHAELPCGMVTRGPARHACFNDGGQAEFSDHPQRFPADIRSAFSGHTDTAKIVHGFVNSKAYRG